MHTVTITTDEHGTYGLFHCDQPDDAECHVYPDSEYWSEDDGQHRYPHDECWLQPWFDNEMADYTGDDGLPEPGWAGVPRVNRTGEIEHVFCMEYVEWKFKGEDR